MKMFKCGFAAVLFCVFILGCASQDKTLTALAVLQEGKARGHLVLTTSAGVSVGTQTEFFLGARGTQISFDGDINFADAEFGDEVLAGVVVPATGG
jgi:hypothetical protein